MLYMGISFSKVGNTGLPNSNTTRHWDIVECDIMMAVSKHHNNMHNMMSMSRFLKL